MERGRQAVLDHFRWSGGHADIWRVFANAEALRQVVNSLAQPWREAGVTHVAGVEARGFLLGAPCALVLTAGFVAIRKDHGVLPGQKAFARTEPDYRQRRYRLRMQRVLSAQDHVLLVDDWAERGSQALAAKRLVEECGARYVGLSVVVDQLTNPVRAMLQPVTSLVLAEELGESARRPDRAE